MKILFIHQGLQSFVKKDLDILREAHEVWSVEFKSSFAGLVGNLCNLWQGVVWCDITFSWFGKLNAFFAVLFSKLLRKKSIVIAGGDDVAKATSTGKPYGVFSHPVKSWFGRYIFKHADLIIAISEYNYKEIVENTPASPKKIKIITHGFDGDIFKWDAEVQKENIVLTVGTVDNENYWRKGFYLIKETARLIPEASFYIVGPQKGMATRWLEKDRPRNLFIPGALYGKDLVDILGRTKVYLQVSEWESFGCALAEAMLCECVSVVFNCTALPEVVGDCGYYIEKLESNELAVKIRMALGDNKTGQKARQRIIREFPLLRRKDALIEAVGQLCDTAKKGH